MSLTDLNHQFLGIVGVNGDNTLTNPSVGGASKLTVIMNLGPQETVP